MESVRIPSPAGLLEGLLQAPPEPRPAWAAVVLHPHPRYGGTLLNKVTERTAGALLKLGFPVLRFNFRGVGASPGTHDEGRGEVDDALAAMDYALRRTKAERLVLAGYSFGAWVGLRAAVDRDEARFFISVGTPVVVYDYAFLQESRLPVGFVQGANDGYGTVEAIRALTLERPAVRFLEIVPDAEHSFTGKLPQLQEGIYRCFERWAPGGALP